MEYYLLFGIFFSLFLGAIVGLQREMRIQKEDILDFAGFRTFSFVSLFGFLVTYIDINFFENNLFLLLSFFGIFLLDITFYYRTSIISKNIGATTNISFLLTFLLGVFVGFEMYYISIVLTIIMVSILFLGNKLHNFSKKLTKNEVFASIKFAIISLVILPFLPNYNYTLLEIPFINSLILSQTLFSIDILQQLDVFNPYKIWLMVVFISSISFIGYILIKTVGANKGIIITSFLGGVASSTATTLSFAIESKKSKYLKIPLIAGTAIACTIMFVKVLIEILVINSEILDNLFLPFLVIIILGISISFYTFKKNKIDSVKNIKVVSPFTLIPALKFGFFFLFIIFISQLFAIIYGSKGIYLVSFFSGLADVDAIVISLLYLAKSGEISVLTAQISIVIASLSNTFVKIFLTYWFGSKDFFEGVLLILGTSLSIGLLFFLF